MTNSWLWTLIDAGVRSLVMAAGVACGLRLLRVTNVIARKAAWTLVLCCSIVMPALVPWAESRAWQPIPIVVPMRTLLQRLAIQRVAIQRLAMRNSAAAPDPAAPARHIFPARAEILPIEQDRHALTDSRAHVGVLPGDRSEAPSMLPHAGSAAQGQSRIDASISNLSWAETAFLVYASVALVLIIRVALGWFATIQLWRRARPVLENASCTNAVIRCSRDVSSPVTVGSGVLLPEDYKSWDLEKLRIVIAHESSHVRQGDFYLQLCASIHAAVFWFSPLGWWLKHTLSDLSEAISDRSAVREAANHASYAQVLLEFAALPHATQIGVAMARTGRLSNRIERLLDESSFRRAFAGGRGRIVVAVLLTPLALFAATSLIRVQAASQEPAPPAAPAMPAPPANAGPAAPPLPSAPGMPAVPDLAPAAPVLPQPPSAPNSMDVMPPLPPSEPSAVGPAQGVRIIGDSSIGSGDSYSYSRSQSEANSSDRRSSSAIGSTNTYHGNRYYYSDNDGESYALISGSDRKHVSFSGDWSDGRREQLEKARSVARGDFLWFTRDDKAYVVDDPAIVAGLLALYKPMEDLGRQQEELGEQQEELGRQQEKLGDQMEQASVPTPDISREMAALNAAIAEINAKQGKTVTQDQIAGLQEKLSDLQSRLGDLQGEVGRKQGELGSQQGELGARQGELGAQQGRLGEQQGRIAREADRKIKSVIDESLKNGKARPVE
jgi:beta-lactamase regulating signal transducer with metallopeptidase domain